MLTTRPPKPHTCDICYSKNWFHVSDTKNVILMAAASLSIAAITFCLCDTFRTRRELQINAIELLRDEADVSGLRRQCCGVS